MAVGAHDGYPVTRYVVAAVVLLTGVAAAVLPPPRLVADINRATGSSSPSGIGFAGGFFYFSTGGHPWRTDGTPTGTVPVLDVPVVRPPGPFRGCDAAHGCELWYSDGTLGGERLVADLQPGTSGSHPDAFVAIGPYSYFRAYFPTFGAVWRTDGTPEGTTLASSAQIPGQPSYDVDGFVRVLDGTLYFTSGEVWATDGTEANTHVVVDLNGPTQSSAARDLVVLDGALYFSASVAGLRQVFHSDGTPAGTHPITAFTGETQRGALYGPLGELTVFGGRLYFRACHVATGCELWASDGTPEGTGLFVDLDEGPADGFEFEFGPTPLANLLLFPANHAALGRELWRTDGTVAGTFVLVNANGTAADSFPSVVIGSEGEEGTQAFFSAEGYGVGTEPWRTDGTSAGTYLLGDLETSGLGSDIQTPVVVGNRVCFRARTTDGSLDAVCSDGTTEGTATVVDVAPRVPGYPDWLRAAGTRLWLSAGDPLSGREPWASDGTPEGSARVADVSPGAAGSDPQEFTAVGDTVYFSATRPDVGRELWRSDGTADGTSLVADLCPGPAGAEPLALAAFDRALLFFANGGTLEEPIHALWRSDGTAAGTAPIGPYGYGPRGYFHLYVADTQVFFGLCGYFPGGCELWRTDGTADGTRRLLDLPEDEAHYRSIESMAVTGDRAVFVVLDIVRTGPEPGAADYATSVWSSDGSREGTAPFLEPLDGYLPLDAVAGPGGVYFAECGVYPCTLYRTDGTAPGTVALFESSEQIGSIAPLPGSDAFVFRACHLDGRCGVWLTDGTRAGTGRVLDPGSASPLALLGDTLMLSGPFADVGDELLALDASTAEPSETTTTTTATSTTVPPPTLPTTTTMRPAPPTCTAAQVAACDDGDRCTLDRCVAPSGRCERSYRGAGGTVDGVRCAVENVIALAAQPIPSCVGRCTCSLGTQATVLERAVDELEAAGTGRACRRRVEVLRRRIRKTITVVQRLRQRRCVGASVAHAFLVELGRARNATARMVASGGCDAARVTQARRRPGSRARRGR